MNLDQIQVKFCSVKVGVFFFFFNVLCLFFLLFVVLITSLVCIRSGDLVVHC